MKIGTKSVLFGAHCFFLHPFFVALAWYQLYGWGRVKIGEVTQVYSTPELGLVPRLAGVTVTRAVFTALWDPRLWLAFFVHDLGYLGKPNMDGEEGEQHPYVGATLMGELFGATWYTFVLAHSRYLAKRNGVPYSALCVADKLAIALTPAWLYLPMVRATGEVAEYMGRAHQRAAANEALSPEERAETTSDDARRWYAGVQAYMRRWVAEHRDLKPDTWTASARTPDPAGVWQ